MNADLTVEIIPFSDELVAPIKILNLEWLTKYFKVEPKDEIVLSDPQGQIIDKGGFIFYAKHNNAIIGTVSLIKMDDSTFELSKMAVTDGVQGLGIGTKMLNHCISFAQEKKWDKLILYSNRKLVSAIHLYEKFGFVEIPLEEGIYERADIKMERTIR
ncbi:GNAT family N-acetyltransferase [Flavobacterium sp. XS1P32]|uniref:GNAT family N-acetyltransferase n=1 Tax=Flavobacterium sp. XS1P32 TaxID=3401726 RepID=UPI003AAF64A6